VFTVAFIDVRKRSLLLGVLTLMRGLGHILNSNLQAHPRGAVAGLR
jgi:hypothetical protein